MSYKDQFKHLFECVFPPIPDNIEWRAHPSMPIEACNVGLLRVVNNDKYYEDMIDRQLDLYSVKRMKLIYECFNNVILPAYCRVRPKNSNPYDIRLENIEVIMTEEVTKERTESIQRERDFRNETVNQMLLREKDLDDDVDVYLYFKDFGISHLIMKNWMSKSPWYKKHYSKKSV